MKCDKCNGNFPEGRIEDSHDVPCYIFIGKNRNEKKNQADKFSRHWLCRSCHDKYEEAVRIIMRDSAISFSTKYFCAQDE